MSGPKQRPENTDALDSAIDAAIGWLYRNQADDGHWVGMLESNCCMEAQWLLAMHFLDSVSYTHLTLPTSDLV